MESVTAGPNSYNTLPRDTPGFSVSYLVRPRRWLAFEAGFSQLIHPVGSSVCCEYSRNASDQIYLVPLGVRFIWQPENSRFGLSIGGGGAYVRHTFGNGSLAADLIGSAGWGGQVVGSADYAITRSGRLRAGVTARYYAASPREFESPGGPGFPPANDQVRIIVFGPEVVFSFH